MVERLFFDGIASECAKMMSVGVDDGIGIGSPHAAGAVLIGLKLAIFGTDVALWHGDLSGCGLRAQHSSFGTLLRMLVAT